jgi:hypothetical protein
MTNSQKAKKIIGLNNAYSKAYYNMQSKLDSLIKGLEEVTGKEIQYNHFPDDDLGVVAGDTSRSNYMHITDAIEHIKNKGTIDEDDFTYL